MNIDIKEIQNLLYVCNVNFYELYINEHNDIVIEMNELSENVDMQGLEDGLTEMFGEIFFSERVTFEEDVIYISLVEL